ncbi:MAG: phosphatase PAP2 family protein [Prevotella sp.]|nr:phosphatase PAP2 family protein [Prevotella sp.]
MKSLMIMVLIVLPVRLTAQQAHSDALDDIVQHVPMASVVVLRACGTEGRAASWGELAMTAGAGYVLAAAATYGLKHVVDERRPDHSDHRAFPSGHATMAFAGAAALRHEYGHLSPWVSIGGYALATLTAADRVRRDRHYVHDVLAGAAIGTAATELTYYINKRFVRARKTEIIVAPQAMSLVVRF